MADTTVKAKITSTSKGLIFPIKWHEPFGLPQIISEAFLYKTPVISTNVGCIFLKLYLQYKWLFNTQR